MKTKILCLLLTGTFFAASFTAKGAWLEWDGGNTHCVDKAYYRFQVKGYSGITFFKWTITNGKDRNSNDTLAERNL